MRGAGILSRLKEAMGAGRQRLLGRPLAADPSLLSGQEIGRAIDTAERNVAAALRAGTRPRPSDLLLLQHLERPKTPARRLREAMFPLAVVILALAILAIAATVRAPVTAVTGNVLTDAVRMDGLDAAGSDVLQISIPVGGDFLAFGMAPLDNTTCVEARPEAGLTIEAESLTLELAGTVSLWLERTRGAPGQTGGMPTQSLDVTTDFRPGEENVLDALGVAGLGSIGAAATCAGNGILSLRPSGTSVNLIVAGIAGGALPDALVLPAVRAERVTFGRFGPGSGPETCALSAATLTQTQEISLLGIAGTSKIVLPEGTCMDLPEGIWSLGVTPQENTLKIWFQSSGGRAVANVDDGVPVRDSLLTYLEILSADPGLGLILGWIVYVLTTIWGAAVLIKRVVA